MKHYCRKAFSAIVLFSAIPLFASAADWPQWLGPERTGAGVESGWDKTLSVGKPLWHLTENVPEGHASPVNVGNRCYLFGMIREEGCVLLCIDVETGETVWKQSYQAAEGTKTNAHSTPTVEGDFIYTYDCSGKLSCWNASDGTLRWNRDLDEERGAFTDWHGMTNSPLIYNGKVIISFMRLIEDEQEREAFLAQRPPHYRMPGWKPEGVPEVHAFDALTGTDVWMNDTDGAGKFPSMVAGVIDEKPTIVVNTSCGVVGLDPETGKAHWVFDEQSSSPKQNEARTTFSSPATPSIVGKDRVIFRKTRGGPVCLKITDGVVNVEWDRSAMLTLEERKKEKPIYYHTSIIWDGMLLAPLHGEDGKTRSSLLALNVADGKKLWRKDGIGGEHKLGGCFTVVDGTVLFRSGHKIVSLKVDPKGAEILGEVTLPGEEFTRGWPYCRLPILANGTLFAPTRSTMTAYDCRLK